MSWGYSVSSVIRLRPQWPRIHSSILSRNNRTLFPKEPPAQFLTTSCFPSDKSAGERRWFRISGDMPPPPHTLSWSIQGKFISLILLHKRHGFHFSLGCYPWQRRGEPTVLWIPSSGRFLPHFFRFKQQFGCQPSSTSWRKAKRLQNSVSCSTRPRAKCAQLREPQGLSFWSLWFISRRCRDLTSRNVDARTNGERWTGTGTEVVAAYSTRLFAVGYMSQWPRVIMCLTGVNI